MNKATIAVLWLALCFGVFGSAAAGPFRFPLEALAACGQQGLMADDAASTPSWTLPTAFLPGEGDGSATGWPVVRPEHRPGAYWWWPGGAVTKSDLTWNLETYRAAGWGNLGVVGIYGVKGEEDRFLDIFSPRWFEMFNHAVAEAGRLEMNIDVTPSSGWRMGGPHVTEQYGETEFAVENGRIVVRPNGAAVKRAGPGGAGLAINPYSESSVAHHLDWLDARWREGDGAAPRAFYYDSFENPGNWCPEFLETFRQLRGYSLEEYAESLAEGGATDLARRVVCDYRETLSDLLLARVEQIARWSDRRGSSLRMQAHGAPANVLDMYAAAGIPETEVFGASEFDIPGYRRDSDLVPADRQSDLIIRFASSAAHVAGRDVVISESFTWLRNHFHTTPAYIKAEADRLLLGGINCIYYHGLCYAPRETEWPGWLFYASTQANARNSVFRDLPVINAYLTRCQSVLQEGRPGNDILLYWPAYDLWMSDGTREVRCSVHYPEWLEQSRCGDAARRLLERGYAYDYISDRQLLRTRCDGTTLRTEGEGVYQTLLVPAAEHVPVSTARQILALAQTGATVLFWRGLPRDVPGRSEHAQRREQLHQLFAGLSWDPSGVAKWGRGKIMVGDDLDQLLAVGDVPREPMVDLGLSYIRRRCESGTTYFIANQSAHPVDDWVPLTAAGSSALVMDPMTARTGWGATAALSTEQVGTFVRLQMQPGESRVVRVLSTEPAAGPRWPVRQVLGEPTAIDGEWRVEFIEGGPVLPAPFATRELKCWTQLGDGQAARFAGAARYTVTFTMPELVADGWYLELGDVRESARVWINGQPVGVAVAHPFRIDLVDRLRPGENQLCIEVTNLSANRVRDLDQRGVPWKKFHDINLVDHRYQPFDASNWDLTPSGLLGPVTLSPYRNEP